MGTWIADKSRRVWPEFAGFLARAGLPVLAATFATPIITRKLGNKRGNRLVATELAPARVLGRGLGWAYQQRQQHDHQGPER
jgi:hypothetical protein